MEIEAKFTVDDDRLWQKYRECASIGAYRVGVERESFVVDEYLDTLYGDIRRAGYHLRVRTSGEEKYVALKSAQSAQSQFSVREETEFSLQGDALDLGNWINTEAVALITPLLRGRVLLPGIQLRQHRGERPVYRCGNALAIMSLDDVQVWHAGRYLDEFRVLEFELEPGADLSVLNEITAVLARDNLIPQPVAKLNRALAAVELALEGTCDVA